MSDKESLTIRSHIHHDFITLLNKIFKKKHKLEYRISKLIICINKLNDVFGSIFCDEMIKSLTKFNFDELDNEERERIEKLFDNVNQKIIDKKLKVYCSDII